MRSSLDALRAQVRYRQHDLEAEADRARQSRAARRPRLLNRRAARRLHAAGAEFIGGTALADQRPFETTGASR